MAIPEMVRAGYDKNFACVVVAVGGTIGALIPPSILLILFGIFAEVSIIQLSLGGVEGGARDGDRLYDGHPADELW